MMETVYLENNIAGHHRVRAILDRFPDATIIPCGNYGEIFNRKAQNFRLQKKQPALILAEKFDHHVLAAPAEFGIGSINNYYFSHMLNCLYDCRYCFLQGMYRSAHYVLFVNYEAFAEAIISATAKHPGETCHFFSGYDCDSLALEPVTGFCDYILPVFSAYPDALLELRTKSTQVRSLLKTRPIDNCIVAFSLSPDSVASALEHKAPGIGSRIKAMLQLQRHGWQIGLRFDPLIYQTGFEAEYDRLFEQVFSSLDQDLIHSVSLGSFRLPAAFFRKITDLYPEERLFASPLIAETGMISYPATIKKVLLSHCRDKILGYIPEHKFFPCEPLPRIA